MHPGIAGHSTIQTPSSSRSMVTVNFIPVLLSSSLPLSDSQDCASFLDCVSLPRLRTLVEELHEFLILAHPVNLPLELLMLLDQCDGLGQAGPRLLDGPALAVGSGHLGTGGDEPIVVTLNDRC